MDNTNQTTIILPTTNEQVPAPPPSSGPSTKTFMILMGVLLLALVTIISFTLRIKQNQPVVQNNQTSTPPTIPQPSSASSIDETANWKPYTNKGLAFSIKYPSTWTYRETTEGYVNLNDTGHKSTFIFFGIPIKAVINGKEASVTTETVSLFITPKTKDYNIEQILEKRYFQSDFLKAQNKYGKDRSVDGIEAKEIINTKCIRDDCITVLLEKDNRIFDFRWSILLKGALTVYPTLQHDKYLQKRETFYQILSTFKFTNQL